MKLIRYQTNGAAHFGRLEGDDVIELDNSYFALTAKPTGKKHTLRDVRLLSPTMPSKIVCLGVNYREHAKEMGKPVPEEPCLFMKPETAVIGPEDEIVYPAMSKQVDHEAELAIVIGRTLKAATPEEAVKCILGYTCLNDVTARDLQRKDGQWTRAKGFDTFCPIGPCIVTDGIDPNNAPISCRVNGVVKQKSNTSEFVFNTGVMLSFISRIMTLRPGDVVATGTPSGISPMKPGDVVEVTIGGIGTLRNRVVS